MSVAVSHIDAGKLLGGGKTFPRIYRSDGERRPWGERILAVHRLSFIAYGEDAVCKGPRYIIPAYIADSR